MRTIFICLSALIVSLPVTLQAQVDAGFSLEVARLIESLNADIDSLKRSRTEIRQLLKTRTLRGRKKKRALNFLEKSGKKISAIKKTRKLGRKVLRNAVKLEVTGSGDLGKLSTQFSRFSSKVLKSERTTRSLSEKLEGFAEENQPEPVANFRGNWNTNFGPITFTQSSRNIVNGTYLWNGGGTVTGKVTGSVLAGRYTSSEGGGRFTVTMNPDGQAWAGGYTSNTGFSQGWAGIR